MYQKEIVYMSLYKNGNRLGNAGFLKVEKRDREGSLSLTVKNAPRSISGRFPVRYYCGTDWKEVDGIAVRDGSGQWEKKEEESLEQIMLQIMLPGGYLIEGAGKAAGPVLKEERPSAEETERAEGERPSAEETERTERERPSEKRRNAQRGNGFQEKRRSAQKGIRIRKDGRKMQSRQELWSRLHGRGNPGGKTGGWSISLLNGRAHGKLLCHRRRLQQDGCGGMRGRRCPCRPWKG